MREQGKWRMRERVRQVENEGESEARGNEGERVVRENEGESRARRE